MVLGTIFIFFVILVFVMSYFSKKKFTSTNDKDEDAQKNDSVLNRERAYAAAVLGAYMQEISTYYAPYEMNMWLKEKIKKERNIWGNLDLFEVNMSKYRSILFQNESHDVRDSLKKELAETILYLSFCRTSVTQVDDGLFFSSYYIDLDNSYVRDLRNMYCQMEKYRAVALLMKRVATISGNPTMVEEEIVRKFVDDKYSSDYVVGSIRCSEYIMTSFRLFTTNDLNRTAYQAIDYLTLFSKDELMRLMNALFMIADAEDGIVYGELYFISQCCFYGGLTETEFLNLCGKFHVKFPTKYMGHCVDGFPKGREMFQKEYEDFWSESTSRSRGEQWKQEYNQRWEEWRKEKQRREEEQRKREEQREREYRQRQEEQRWQDEQRRQEQQRQQEGRRRQEEYQRRQKEKREAETRTHLDRYYEILNVTRDVPFEEIKKAYRKMALKCHPDRLGPDATSEEIKKANERLIEINDAYKILCELQG